MANLLRNQPKQTQDGGEHFPIEFEASLWSCVWECVCFFFRFQRFQFPTWVQQFHLLFWRSLTSKRQSFAENSVQISNLSSYWSGMKTFKCQFLFKILLPCRPDNLIVVDVTVKLKWLAWLLQNGFSHAPKMFDFKRATVCDGEWKFLHVYFIEFKGRFFSHLIYYLFLISSSIYLSSVRLFHLLLR